MNTSETFCTSLQFAQEFGREHSQILKDIRDMKCSEDFKQGNFQEATYIDNNGTEYSVFIMTHGGFFFLISGYDSEEALYHTILFVQRFKAMEDFLGWDNSDLFINFFSKED